MTVIGVISGTSHDAADAAVAWLSLGDDVLALEPRGVHSEPIPSDIRARIAACLPPATTTVAEICRLDTEMGQLFGSVATAANQAHAGGRASLIASHGQTVYHWVEGQKARGTLQLGSAAWIANATGLPVISDLRTRDITRGGHAAPLASIVDALLFCQDHHTIGSLNLGASLTSRFALPRAR
jgi:anhydro-N-acetylmuramic acid kinase